MSHLLNKKRLWITGVALAVLVAGYAIFGGGGSGARYDTVSVARMDLSYLVSVTGDVVAAGDADLAFEQSGTIAAVYAGVSERVRAGQALVAQESGSARALLAGARADLSTQEALLAELKAGTRSEEISVYEAKLRAAERAFAEAQTDLNHKISDAYTKCDDAVRNNIDQFFNNPRSTNPTLNFTMYDQQLQVNIESQRFAVEELLNKWFVDATQTGAEEALSYSEKAKELLDKISFAVNALTASSALSQTTIDGYKADVSTARSGVNTAITNLNTAAEKLSTAETNALVAEKELALKKSGSSAEQIAAQEAKVASAESNVKNLEAQLAKRTLYAPFAGTITRQDARLGEIAAANTTLVSLISDATFEIESYIPEADIAKVSVGDTASFDLDAYEADVIFTAEVLSIEPAETVIEGVSTYKTTLGIRDADERIRLGMTANVEILTAQKEGVLAVPARAVIEREERAEKYVRVLSADGMLEERPVETGLRGSEGMIEIMSGLAEGEEVVTFIRN